MRFFRLPLLAAAMSAVALAPVLAQGTPPRRATAGASAPRAQTTASGEILRRLLERGHAESAAIRTAELRVLAAQAETRQARTYPNPELTVELENFGGTGAYRGVRSLESTVGLAQRLEVNGERTARISGAQAGLILAERDLQIARLEAERDIVTGYAAFVAAFRNAEVERDRWRLAGEVVAATRVRLTAGRDPLVELRRAEVAEANARLAADRAERETETTRRSLATVLGAATIDVAPDHAWFESIGSAPVVARPEADSPDIARLQAEVARNRASLATERANALPNPTVRAGVRQFQDTRDTAVVLGFAVPIPVLNTNRAAIERAGFDLARSEAEAAQLALTFNARLADAVRRQELAWREANSIRRVVLPAAQETQALAREGYVSGRFNLIEALDAQRTLTDARLQYNAALQEFHTRKAEADRLSGRSSGATTRAGAGSR